MSGRYRGADGVTTLLRIAKTDAETLRVDLTDVDRACAAASAEVENISAAMKRQEEASTDPAAFAAYADAMRERRFNLMKTLKALDVTRAAADEKLKTALAEIAKLQRLADINAAEALKARRKRDAAADNDAALQGARQKTLAR